MGARLSQLACDRTWLPWPADEAPGQLTGRLAVEVSDRAGHDGRPVAISGMSSTPSISRTRLSRDRGRHGAMPAPQLPVP